MKKIIKLNEDDLVKIINKVILESSEIDESILSGIVNKISKFVGLGSKNIPALSNEISRVIPKQYLTNPKEVNALIKRLGGLGKEVDTLKLNFIKKYGQEEYDLLLRKYLYGGVDKKTFLDKLRSVKNPTLRLKPVAGEGRDHRVFMSSVHPDKLFKVEMRPGEVDKWFNTFNSRPDIFPKVFKKVKVKDADGKYLTAVVVEKLETQPFRNLWYEMETLLKQSEKNLPVGQKNSSLEHLSKRLNTSPVYRESWDNFLLYAKKQRPDLKNKIEEFTNNVDKLYKITPNPDIRQFNFGYDKTGKLKCLDL